MTPLLLFMFNNSSNPVVKYEVWPVNQTDEDFLTQFSFQAVLSILIVSHFAADTTVFKIIGNQTTTARIGFDL